MKTFSVVLELESESHSAVAMKFTSKSEIGIFAADESRARTLIRENFGHRIVAGHSYEIKCEGDAPVNAKEGFAIRPIE